MTMLEIGRIVKPHGLKGEVVVELFTNRQERLAPGSVLTTAVGELVVEKSKTHQHRWIVLFAGVGSREAAEDLRSVVLSAEPLDDPDALWVHELMGSEVLDVGGRRLGSVTGVLANPAGDILELDGGALVPLRFVVEHGHGFVRVDPPPGLFEIYEKA